MSLPKSRKVRTYETDTIDVNYEARRCIHAKECVSRLSEVFDIEKRPWIQPANANADKLADTIEHCPTGALSYRRKDGGADEAAPSENVLRIETDGPIYVKGDVQISVQGETQTETRMALCRCGQSQNKPFCDNSHLEDEFEASDVLADNLSRSKEVSGTGTLEINPAQNGPLLLAGEFTLHSSDGQTIFQGEKAALCRCGASGNKPFCDGTHHSVGFEAE